RLMGKAAVITGAASGIGRASALRFARAGARLLLVDTQGAAGEALVQEIERSGGAAHFVCGDVGRRADSERMIDMCVARYGGLDILFCNAGVNLPKVLTQSSDDEIDHVLDVNVKGPLYAARHAIPIMVRQARGVRRGRAVAGVPGSLVRHGRRTARGRRLHRDVTMPTTITRVDALDIRFPTSRERDGSDAMSPDPDYSAAYAILHTDRPDG